MKTLLLVFVSVTLLTLFTSQSAAYAQPVTPANLAGPGTTLLTTFSNGTSKVTWVNGTTVQVLNGVGYLVLDPSASVAASASASAPVSNTVVNRFYQAIAIAINIEQNDTVIEPPVLPPLPNSTDPIPEPPSDEVLPYCDLVGEDYTGSCHDRQDFDDETGLYPCNDGTQRKDWRNCPDASVAPSEEPEPELDNIREISSEGCGAGFGYYIDDPNPICEPTDSIGEGPPPDQMFCAAIGCPYNPPDLEEEPPCPPGTVPSGDACVPIGEGEEEGSSEQPPEESEESQEEDIEQEPQPIEEENGNGDNEDSNDEDQQNGDDDGEDENENNDGYGGDEEEGSDNR